MSSTEYITSTEMSRKSIYELEAALSHLKQKRKEAALPFLIASIIVLLVIPIEVFISISFFIHWFNQDHITLMQNFKWSLNAFWYLWAYIIASNIFRCTKFTDMKFEFDATNNSIMRIQDELKRRDIK